MTDLSTTLKESWALVEDRQDRLARHFYARLFLTDPQLRDLFPVQMDVQRNRLLGAIVSAVQHVDDAETLDGYLRELGRDHRKFHVTPQHYAQVKLALLDALRTCAGEDWSSVYEQAWNDVYDVISRTMIAGAAAETGPPYWHAEVLTHERRGADVAVFTCRPLQPLTFRAGQYVSLECAYQPRLWRTYSMANAPRADGTLEFHVRAVGGGWVSSALVRRLRPGDMLRLAAPMGSMTLEPQSRRDIVFVTGGTGLAPAKALLDELSRYNRTRWVHLFRGERRAGDFYDKDHLDALAETYPWLTIVRAVSDDPDTPVESGPVAEVVARHGPWNHHDFYVSGSAPMVNATLKQLSALRVPSTRIKYDAFTDA
ncbi:globin domain-containing protein [Spirilliplanes yamanashiensis]|uniref:nitric oxide dioxygenase n=1 Tax=Spirilliplanes yamanashiensis TaxID=42233 RepID=A0A8J3YBC4_9ACTN|nr:globin domain-containing protein [Spirilliplanes yamanashiensis]MDP9818143.1 NAD(P)H-flavin reductase/hemoglobin-like flavoprotein [Spirilliplanes yamanashiensis]GIJ04954.1 flavohemoprotein [Spirilliplanes yamanashiensis]